MANTLNSLCQGAVGFIEWLDGLPKSVPRERANKTGNPTDYGSNNVERPRLGRDTSDTWHTAKP